MKHTLFCYIHLQASGAHGKETMWVEVEKEDQSDRNFEHVASSSWFISEGNGGERFGSGRGGGGRVSFSTQTYALLFFRNRYHFLHPKYQLTE